MSMPVTERCAYASRAVVRFTEDLTDCALWIAFIVLLVTIVILLPFLFPFAVLRPDLAAEYLLRMAAFAERKADEQLARQRKRDEEDDWEWYDDDDDHREDAA